MYLRHCLACGKLYIDILTLLKARDFLKADGSVFPVIKTVAMSSLLVAPLTYHGHRVRRYFHLTQTLVEQWGVYDKLWPNTCSPRRKVLR